jgi:hemerythrin
MVIHWDDKLSVGNDLIDQQHRMMMMLCRKLDIAIKTEQQTETIDFIIHELRGYTEFHFFSEENVMREIGFPQLREHTQIHTELLTDLNNMTQKWRRREFPPGDTLAFLYRWLIRHIVGEDSKIGRYAKSSERLPIGNECYDQFFKRDSAPRTITSRNQATGLPTYSSSR